MKKTNIMLGLAALLAGLSLASCGHFEVGNDKIVIGLECNYAPFNWTEASENSFTLPISNHADSFADGYDVQIGKLLGEKLGKEVVIVEQQWESLIPDLQTGSINAIIAGMTDNAERRQAIDFTDEYYRSELVFVVTAEEAAKFTGVIRAEKVASFVNGKMFVSQVQTMTDDIIEDKLKKMGAIHNTPVSTFALAAQDVARGSAYAMTAEYPVAQSIVASNNALGIVRIDQSVLGDLSDLGVSIGIKKGNDSFRDDLNRALADISQEQRNTLMAEAVARSAN